MHIASSLTHRMVFLVVPVVVPVFQISRHLDIRTTKCPESDLVKDITIVERNDERIPRRRTGSDATKVLLDLGSLPMSKIMAQYVRLADS